MATTWSPDLAPSLVEPDGRGSNVLSVVVIGPDDRRRETISRAVGGPLCGVPQQLPIYPDLDQLPKLVEYNYDVIIVDLDSDPEYALKMVEMLGAITTATVMVYSVSSDQDRMIRCMRVGAREFLTLTVTPAFMGEALQRAASRRSTARSVLKADGKLWVFWGAKGGAGVTIIATNFAISIAKESGQKVLLIDLDLPLGDLLLNLGLTPQYSTVDALESFARLDANFLSKLLVQHESGIHVLGAPGKLVKVPQALEAVDRLIQVARQEFDHVVVDSGSRLDLNGTALFDPKSHLYLVSQVGIPELRNSHRLANELFNASSPQFEVVLNRYEPTALGLDDDQIAKVLTRAPQWKIPNDFEAVREMQNTATPLALLDSPISRSIRSMAKAACGISEQPKKRKKIMGLF